MSKNIHQIFVANPITSNVSTDLMYFGQSPYGNTNDAAMTYANFSAQFTLKVQTTKGDLIGFSTLPVRVGVGSNGQLLQSDSTAAAGISWSTPTFPTSSATAGKIMQSDGTNWIASSATWPTAHTSGKIVIGNGTNYVESTPSYPNASATANSLIISDGTNYIASTSLWANTVGSAGKIIRSDGTTNTYTTSTFADTYSINNILYASGANTVTGLATANGGVLVTSNTGVPSVLAGSGTTGTVLTATASGTPAWSTATYPLTTTINQIIYSSAANTVSGLATANGGVLVTSNSGVPSVLAGSGTTGTVLTATASGTPAWSTAAYPLTTTISQLLYSSANNTVTGLATTNNASLSTNATGVPTWLALTDGQVVIGSSTGAPLAATLSAGTGISITNGHNTISIASNGANPWVDQTGASVTMAANTGYTSDDGATLVTFTLPTSASIGDWVEIQGKGSGGWTIAQAASQQIHFGSSTTTAGVTGTLSSSNQYDCVKLRALTSGATSTWSVVSAVGNLTVV